MNRLLTLLMLVWFGASYSQVSTGAETDFDYGLRNLAPQTVSTPAYLCTQGIDGTIGIIPSAYIAKTATTVNVNGVSQDLSADRTYRTAQADTGVLTFAGLTTNTSTTINIGAVVGVVVDNETNPSIPTFTAVNYAGATGVAVTTVGSGQSSYVMLSSAGVISFQNTFPTSAERKAKIWLGKVSHPSGSITLVVNEPDYITSPMAYSRDLLQGLGGYINDGVYPVANGANLNMNITAGNIHGDGINFVNSRTNPNELSMGPTTVATFTYRTQTGGTSTGVTAFIPGSYDVSGTITAVPGPGATSTIQYIYAIPGLGYIVQYGQFTYSTLATAVANVGKENFVKWSNLTNNAILIGVLVARKDATALNDTNQAVFFQADRLGGLIGSSSGFSTATLQTTYNNSVSPQITTSNTLGPVVYKNGSGFDFNNTQVWQDNSGAQKATVNGTGDFTANSYIKSGGTSTQGLLADGSVLTNPMDLGSAQTVTGVKTFNDGKLGFRNTANTFTSFFTNAATASRTWTWPDKDGIIAMTTDNPWIKSSNDITPSSLTSNIIFRNNDGTDNSSHFHTWAISHENISLTNGNSGGKFTMNYANITLNSSLAFKYRALSTTQTIAINDYLLDCTSGTFTLTLPTSVGFTGKQYIVKNSGTGVITVATTSSQTIDGSTTYNLSAQYKYVTIVSNGANWIITANN